MSMMKVLFLSLLFSWMFVTTSAAQSERIYISVLQPDDQNIPAEAAKQLELKLNRLLTQNGIASEDPNNRFVLTAKAAVTTKDIVAGPPQKVSMNIDFTFITGDAEANKKFESVTISTCGVGQNENKAVISAIKNIKPNNPLLIKLISDSKKEICDYYNSECLRIQQEAAIEAEQRNYEKAIYLLMQIPDVCECASDAREAMILYSREYLNNKAACKLNEAKAVWASKPDAESATAVADIITQIPANTPSQKGVDSLIAEINKKLREEQKKEWEFKIKQYNDSIEKQKRDDMLRLEQQRDDNLYRDKQQQINFITRQQSIEAARQVGITYAKNQPKSVTYHRNIILW